MLEEFTPTNFDDIRGLFANGPEENTPPGYLRKGTNIRYLRGGTETRWGTGLSISVPDGVRRWFPYKIEGQTNRIIYLDNTGKLFDSLYTGSPILNIPNMVDFSMVVFNERAYISPHDRRRGLPGQLVYIYMGGGLQARPAASEKPRGFSMFATAFVGGKIEQGFRYFAVAFETDTGYVSIPGPETYALLGTADNVQIQIENIGRGPSYVVARHILATKRQPAATFVPGDQNGPELFFVPNGRIPNNEDTTYMASFYDSELQRSADYLIDQMETIPAVLGLGTYAGGLVGWGSQNDDSTVYISKAGEPESISLVEGGIEIDKSEGGGVRNCVEYRGQLIIHKSSRSYAVQQNGQEPAFWDSPISLDRAVGTEVFGVAAVLDDEGATVDRYLVAARQGLLVFNGTYETNLTDSITDIWARITKTAFNTVQVTLDPINAIVYVTCPLDGASSPNTILYGDITEGMSPDKIKWAIWTFPYSPTTIGIDTDINEKPIFKIGSTTSNLYYLDPTALNDNLVAIPDPTIQFSYVGSREWAVSQFGGVRLRATGNGILRLEMVGLDDVVSVQPPSLTLGSTGKVLQREFDLQSQAASLRAWTSSANERFKITKVSVYSTPLWFEEPSGV